MKSNAYTMLGFLVWKGGRWYLRRTYQSKLPSTRTLATVAGGLGALSAAGAAALAVRRSSS